MISLSILIILFPDPIIYIINQAFEYFPFN